MAFKGSKNTKLDFSMFTLSGDANWITIRDDDDKAIAQINGRHYDIDDDICKDNAMLFQRAPEMLQMLILLSNIDAEDFTHSIQEEIEIIIRDIN